MEVHPLPRAGASSLLRTHLCNHYNDMILDLHDTMLQGRDAHNEAFRVVAIKGTSDFFSVVDDLRLYTETVLFQILSKFNIFYDYTFGHIVNASTFIGILDATIEQNKHSDINQFPKIRGGIEACIAHTVNALRVDLTLTGHSLGGGLALHLADECAAAALNHINPFCLSVHPHAEYWCRFPQIRSMTFNAPGSKYSSASKSSCGKEKKADGGKELKTKKKVKR